VGGTVSLRVNVECRQVAMKWRASAGQRGRKNRSEHPIDRERRAGKGRCKRLLGTVSMEVGEPKEGGRARFRETRTQMGVGCGKAGIAKNLKKTRGEGADHSLRLPVCSMIEGKGEEANWEAVQQQRER